jgi:hypothetical protein
MQVLYKNNEIDDIKIFTIATATNDITNIENILKVFKKSMKEEYVDVETDKNGHFIVKSPSFNIEIIDILISDKQTDILYVKKYL